MKKTILAIVLLLVMTGSASLAEQQWIDARNKTHFADLFYALVSAYEAPSAKDDARIDSLIEEIRRVRDSGRHAFVVLGYELKDGQMQPELKGRCDAAAAAARSYPSTILVCSGGATGDNNPKLRTEAGVMKAYLVETCGIDASRIHIDENARTTLQNARNTLDMLQAQGIETMTLVTSTYHQRWGQVIYNAVAALYRQVYGYTVEIVGNYCYETEPAHESYRNDDRIAISQVAQLLGVPLAKDK